MRFSSRAIVLLSRFSFFPMAAQLSPFRLNTSIRSRSFWLNGLYFFMSLMVAYSFLLPQALHFIIELVFIKNILCLKRDFTSAINYVLDIVLRQKGEDASIGVVTHGGNVMFRIDKVK